MTIFRVQHKKNYTQVNNYICKDNSLSYKAKGIWLYAFSRPDDWQFHLNDLINKSTDGEKSVRSGLIELEKSGYLRRTQDKDSKGKFSQVEWEFYETPTDIIKEMLPQAQNGEAVKGDAQKEVLPSTKEKLKTKENQQPPTPPKPTPEKSNQKVGGVGSIDEIKEEFGPKIFKAAMAEYEVAYRKSVARHNPIKHQVTYLKKICMRLKVRELTQTVPVVDESDLNRQASLNGEKAYTSKKTTIPGYTLEAKDDFVRFITPTKSVDIPYNLSHQDFLYKCTPYILKLKL